jgi:hypothetical protein
VTRYVSDWICREPQRCRHVLQLQRRHLLNHLRRRHPAGDHPDHRGHRDPQTPDTRHPTHLPRVDRDPLHDTGLRPTCDMRGRPEATSLTANGTHLRSRSCPPIRRESGVYSGLLRSPRRASYRLRMDPHGHESGTRVWCRTICLGRAETPCERRAFLTGLRLASSTELSDGHPAPGQEGSVSVADAHLADWRSAPSPSGSARRCRGFRPSHTRPCPGQVPALRRPARRGARGTRTER